MTASENEEDDSYLRQSAIITLIWLMVMLIWGLLMINFGGALQRAIAG